LGALGALVGAFAGERVANSAAASEAQEIVIGIRDPRTNSITRVVTVVQPAPFDAVAPDDNVLIVNTNGAIRVIKRTYNTASVQR
jgi:outer membrane lipoprotein SlyB